MNKMTKLTKINNNLLKSRKGTKICLNLTKWGKVDAQKRNNSKKTLSDENLIGRIISNSYL